RSGYEAILAAMQASFTTTESVLEPLDSAQQILDKDLLSGFEIRRPKHSKSGIFITESGTLITTTAAVEGCRAITIDSDYSAEVTAIDTALGVALVTPTEALSPISVGRFSKLPAQLGQQIVTAGYSFEGILETSSLTNGVITDTKGLFEESDQMRLTLPALSGDAGGPVLGATATVLGMLKDRETSARSLPDDVSLAITSDALIHLLKRNGVRARTAGTLSAITKGQRAKTARDITAMVSCWE
ncbi:MAG: serine protease, partial [Paracoccaceae bacterium]|nr:serine protease [Paracoccaceae bacterium]